jgi:hypothetical protein
MIETSPMNPTALLELLAWESA